MTIKKSGYSIGAISIFIKNNYPNYNRVDLTLKNSDQDDQFDEVAFSCIPNKSYDHRSNYDVIITDEPYNETYIDEFDARVICINPYNNDDGNLNTYVTVRVNKVTEGNLYSDINFKVDGEFECLIGSSISIYIK